MSRSDTTPDAPGGVGSQIGDIPRCPFCGEPMMGFEIPDHVRREHSPGGERDD